MSFKYRQSYFENGDIVDPRDWNRNITELTDELNGYLDRDNLPEDSFTVEHVAQNAFNVLYSNLADTVAEHRTISGNPQRVSGLVILRLHQTRTRWRLWSGRALGFGRQPHRHMSGHQAPQMPKMCWSTTFRTEF
jgi:hypothetical protein